MREIRINLAAAGSLGPLAAPVVGAGLLPAGMPAGPPGGIYLIVNTTTNNRYAGISTNIAVRFTGRMAVINELGFATVTLTPVWGWWGRVTTREYPAPAQFPTALATTLAGLPLANRYAFPMGVAATICPAPIPFALPAAPTLMAAARAAVVAPIRQAVAAYQAWTGAALPRTALTVAAAWPAAIAPVPLGGAGAVAVAVSAQAAAQTVATNAGAPLPVAVAAAAAVHAYATGGLPAASDAASAVGEHYGGAVMAAPLPATVALYRNPIAGPPTTLTHTFTTGGLVDLEHVFIRFVLHHLVGGPGVAFVTNGAKTGPLPWPGGAQPIAVTWNSCAGGGFAPFSRSVIWWPGTPF
jgi:hypothetical protein